MIKEEYKKRMENSKYKELNVTTCGDGKDYVFISYKSDNWEQVLTDIVYKLQKEYGLRVYFDKDFASEANIWIKQFQKNMDSNRCKAFLCFWSKEYVKSYATLLELMHSMNKKANVKNNIYPIVFPVDLDEIIDSNEADDDTGLGNINTDDKTSQLERQYFDREFSLLRKKYPEIDEYYDLNDDKLTVGCCASIFKILKPQNLRLFVDSEDFYRQFIIEPLKKIENADLFDEPALQPEVTTYNNENDKNRTTYEYTHFFDDPVSPPSSEDETYYLITDARHSINAVIRKDNEGYTLLKNSKIKLEYNKSTPSKSRKYFENSMINKNNERIITMDITDKSSSPLAGTIFGGSKSGNEMLCNAEVITEDAAKKILSENEMDVINQSVPDKPSEIEPNDKNNKEKGKTLYNYTLYGKQYDNSQLNEMMITIFTEVLFHNPDKLDEALVKCKSCLREGDIIGKNKVGTTINGYKVSTIFRNGKVIKINKKEISIGTSLNATDVRRKIEKLFEVCDISDDVFYLKDMTSEA